MRPGIFDDLHVFLTVADAGSVAAGARSLAMDPSTASRRISRLEETLGITLFLRSGRGVALSEAGGQLAVRVRAAVGQIELGVDEATRPPDALAGTVRVTAPTEIGATFLLPELPAFRAAHPGVVVALELGAHVVSLEQGEADIALRTFRPTRGDVVTRRVGSLPARPHRAPRVSDAEARLSWGAWIGDDPAVETLVSEIPEARIVFRCNDLSGLRAAAVQGLCTVLVPDQLGSRVGLVPVAGFPSAHGPPMFIAAPRISLEIPRVRALWRYILERFGALAS